MKYIQLMLLMMAIVLSFPTPVFASGDHDHKTADGNGGHHEDEKGPNGGRLLQQDSFSIELTIFEDGISPEFRVYVYENEIPLDLKKVELKVQLHRLDGEIDKIQFTPANNYLRGDQVIAEPHSFDIHVQAQYAGRAYQWEFESYEGRTDIEASIAQEANVKTSIAGSVQIKQTKMLYGTVRPNEERVFKIQAPYQGRIQAIHVSVGDTVQKGQALALVQSQDSLETYTITAPSSGIIISRHANKNELTGSDALLVLADLSQLWIDFAAFPSQYPWLRKGQTVYIKNATDGETSQARIEYLARIGSSASQSVLARAILANPSSNWLPGLLVTGEVVVSENDVPLAVKLSALQTYRDFTVVFAKYGDTYEVRMLELGQRDGEYVEVLSGLKPGTEYVTSNSYLIKADILKSGASHDH